MGGLYRGAGPRLRQGAETTHPGPSLRRGIHPGPDGRNGPWMPRGAAREREADRRVSRRPPVAGFIEATTR